MDSLKLGFFDSPIHEVTAAVIIRVLEAHGMMDIELVTGESTALIQELCSGDIDLLVGMWLPDAHARIVHANSSLKAIGNLYQPFLFMALPAIWKGQVTSIDQLRSMESVEREIKVDETFYDYADQVMTSYGLFKAGYRLLPVSNETVSMTYRRNVEAQGNALMLLANPGLLVDSEKIYPLEDPEGILSKEQKAVIMVNRKWAGNLESDLIDELEEMMLGNQAVQLLEDVMVNQGMDADAAAEDWQRGKLVVRT